MGVKGGSSNKTELEETVVDKVTGLVEIDAATVEKLSIGDPTNDRVLLASKVLTTSTSNMGNEMGRVQPTTEKGVLSASKGLTTGTSNMENESRVRSKCSNPTTEITQFINEMVYYSITWSEIKSMAINSKG